MNIGIFIPTYLPEIGGAQICAHCLATGLSQIGNNVTVYSDKNLVRACNDLKWHFNYTLKGISKLPFRIIRCFPWLRRWITARVMAQIVLSDKLDVIQIIISWPWLPAARRVKSVTGAPVFIRCAGDDIQIDDSLGYGIRRDVKIRRLLSEGFQSVDKGIAISATVTEEYVKAGIPRNRIVEIPPGVDIDAFNECKIDVREIRKKWNIPNAKKLIVSVGRNHPKKGFTDLLQSLAILNQDEEQFVVAVVGKDSNKLIADAERFGVKESFFPIKELADMPKGKDGTFPSTELIELYKASDYFVLASYLETYANVALEAMAAGIPAIVTNTPGCIDTVKDYEDGLVVPVKDPEKIAEKILLLEGNEELRAKIIQKGMIKAMNQDWNKIAHKYLDVYKTAL